MNARRGLALMAVALCLAACSREQPKAVENEPPRRWAEVDDARLAKAEEEPQNWMAHGGSQRAQRFSTLDQISVDTVSRLKPAWSLDFDTYRGQEATPLVVDGIAYVTTAWSKVYAVDAKTGKQLWQFDPQVPGASAAKNCCDVVNRGAAVYAGKVYVGTFDGRLIALDASSGKPVWTAQTVDPNLMYTITGAPRVGRGLVYVGNGGGEFGGRGYVTAYDAESGAQVWRFFTTPGDPAKADGVASDAIHKSLTQKTWFGPFNEHRGGGNVWNSIIYDPELDQVYLATGNGYPWARKFRSAGKGDNLFICSVVALDAASGEYRWHYQETPGDSWDYDSVADMILADLDLAGEKRQVLMHTPKNGFFYVLDRRSGALVSAEPFVPGITWASRVDPKTGRPDIAPGAYYDRKPVVLSPGEGGAHGWQPTAFSPRTGLFYVQAQANARTRYIPRATFEYVKGLDNIGLWHFAQHGPEEDGPPPADPTAPPVESYLLAWDPVAKKAAWKTPGQGNGVLATAGNLVFQGQARDAIMGALVAYRADNGERIWSHETPNALMSAPITYSVDGEQYVLTVSGAGGVAIVASPQVMRERQPGRLIAFKLDGAAKLPADPAPVGPVPMPTQTFPETQAALGKDLYTQQCARCHGIATRASNIIPDLRRSKALGDAALWKSIVEDGVLSANGMIAWKSFLPPNGAEAIRAYVTGEARVAATAAR
ncbi:MAG: PQQ-dependent dehydrogenase, methanol/ethanol family [Steroidobacteraceae bacterium]